MDLNHQDLSFLTFLLLNMRDSELWKPMWACGVHDYILRLTVWTSEKLIQLIRFEINLSIHIHCHVALIIQKDFFEKDASTFKAFLFDHFYQPLNLE